MLAGCSHGDATPATITPATSTPATSTPATSTPATSTPATETVPSTTSAFPVAASTDPEPADSDPANPDPMEPDTGEGVALAGTSTVSIEFGGQTRTATLVVPSRWADGIPPTLVVALHGGGGSGQQFADASRFAEYAEREGFAVAFPDGVALRPVNLQRDLRTWNAGRCCGPAVRDGVDDVGYLAALIDKITPQLAAPDGRSVSVAMVGHSNGAMMTWRVACERPELLNAAVVVAGSLEVADLNGCRSSSGVSLLLIHGTADTNHPLDGGKGSGVSGVLFRSLAESIAAWLGAHGCTQPSSDPQPTAEGVTSTVWTGCTDDTRVERVIIDGAQHPWPGANSDAVATQLSGTPTDKLDATAAAWEFIVRTAS
jgi:polyhydroxybutyrate depolymerase